MLGVREVLPYIRMLSPDGAGPNQRNLERQTIAATCGDSGRRGQLHGERSLDNDNIKAEPLHTRSLTHKHSLTSLAPASKLHRQKYSLQRVGIILVINISKWCSISLSNESKPLQ